jgi:hypothetical protein
VQTEAAALLATLLTKLPGVDSMHEALRDGAAEIEKFGKVALDLTAHAADIPVDALILPQLQLGDRLPHLAASAAAAAAAAIPFHSSGAAFVQAAVDGWQHGGF